MSEETGAISVAIDGMLKRHLNSSTFDKILHSELVLDEAETDRSIWKAIKKLLTVEKNEEEKTINEKNN